MASGKRYAAVAFKKRGGAYRGSVELRDLPLLRDDPADTMQAVTAIYQGALKEIRQWQRDAEALRLSRIPLTSRQAWDLGDIVHRLQANLAVHLCRLDGLYEHLARHAGTSRWLKEYVTFRRYVEDVETIPECLNWNSIAKRPKAAGQAISAGLDLENES